jgi:hypothetical protein
MTPLEEAAWEDFDQAQSAYYADPSRESLAAYEAAAWALQAAIARAIEVGSGSPRHGA